MVKVAADTGEGGQGAEQLEVRQGAGVGDAVGDAPADRCAGDADGPAAATRVPTWVMERPET
ncbi:hypothetical protein M2271_003882 [Streptomyces sp. LBL]|uniref:hypothetical protein n=1 Tax=Streptomyces sp. LBL TaxID=2940562 RepID=UPI0024734545|nr:hypothetical protein [Streptomyces sp. LBL]MDH6626066.1 hypothetical protein [Streptomyces sp. LBL]